MAKATAVRNIRDDHQKAFLKIFNSLCGRFNRWQVWQDFVMVTAIEISNATDKQNAPERTKTYQTIISKYSDKDRLVRFNGFFPKPQSGTYLILDEGGYQVAGQKGTWLVSDEVEVDGQRFVQMRSEQAKNPPPSIILHENGAFVTQTALGFDGEATRKMRAFLQGPKPELLHHQKFFENGTAERAKESGTEQNYNMIDGCVNNVPKKPRRIGGRWSVLDRLHIKQAERRQKDNAPQQEQERSRKS